MLTHQNWSTCLSATRNGNYNQATGQPSVPNSRFPLAVPANHRAVGAMTRGPVRPAAQVNASYITPAARRLLTEAHQTMFSELTQHGRNATLMDMILDHRLLITVETLPADGGHRSPAPRNCAFRCQADVDAYWAWQEERRGFVSPTVGGNIELPVSAERSTMAWPPNFDGDEVWDCAS